MSVQDTNRNLTTRVKKVGVGHLYANNIISRRGWPGIYQTDSSSVISTHSQVCIMSPAGNGMAGVEMGRKEDWVWVVARVCLAFYEYIPIDR